MAKPARIAAWMLTPVVVWAGTFFAGWAGAWVGGRLLWLIVGAVVGGVVAILGWSYLLLHSKRANAEKAK